MATGLRNKLWVSGHVCAINMKERKKEKKNSLKSSTQLCYLNCYYLSLPAQAIIIPDYGM
jgi:hypothetical protein